MEAPERVVGGHRWIAMVVYDLDDAQAKAMNDGPIGPPSFGMVTENPRMLPDGRANLRVEDIDQESTSVGCLTCEQPWSPELAARACPGEPTGYGPTGEPQWRKHG